MNFLKQGMLAALMLSMAVPAVNAQKADTTFIRSSLYTILIKSDEQNKKLDEENAVQDNNLLTSMVTSFAKTDERKAANGDGEQSLASIPAQIFTKIPIPAQFNDHNLEVRILDFDALKEGMTQEDADAAKEAQGGKKKSKFGAFAKGMAAGAMAGKDGKSALINTDNTADFIPAVLLKHFANNKVAAHMTARWFDYNPEGEQKWADNTLNERALQSLSIEEQGGDAKSKIMAAGAKAFNLIPNTFVLATNLRFRTNKAIMAEAQALADAAGSAFGGYGKLASMAAGAAAKAALGDGFSVQAESHLYRLVWDENVEEQINKVLENNGSIDDLIASGVCKLEYVGKEKTRTSVRQSILSDKPFTELVGRATARAIDASIAKLQEKNEVFRSKFPISDFDKDGNIIVKIGEREGVAKGDTYAVLEKVEDADGKISYKEIGTVKPDEKLIWNNLAGAQAEYEENLAHKEGKSDDFNNDAVKLGATTFKGKKGKDYTGCYVQLKKKK